MPGFTTSHIWQPVSFNFLFEPVNRKHAWKIFLVWILLIAVSLTLTYLLFQSDLITLTISDNEIIDFFILNPALITGTLLLFWLGFEWGFIPVYLSSFAIAMMAGISVFWSSIIGLAFALGLGFFALAYHSLQIPYNLRSLSSIALFVVVSFIAALASSMGSFIWSFFNNLSAYDTLIVWKSWWTGIFFQSILITAPLLYLLTPFIEDKKHKYFTLPKNPVVSVKWIYGSVIGVAATLSMFIFSGYMLGKLNVEETVNQFSRTPAEDIMGALEAFEIITWTSIGLIIITAVTAIYLLNNWNESLQSEVHEQTKSLIENKEKLKKSLQEKDILFKEVQHRVKNNLAQVHGLLELQETMSSNEETSDILKMSKSRIRTMSLAHEALYNSNDFSEISLKAYLERISDVTHTSFKDNLKKIELSYEIEDLHLNMAKAIPLGLMVSEILINAHKHAFNGRDDGLLKIENKILNDELHLTVSDNGSGIPKDLDLKQSNSLGMIIVQNFTDQMKGKLTIDSDSTGSRFIFSIPLKSIQD